MSVYSLNFIFPSVVVFKGIFGGDLITYSYKEIVKILIENGWRLKRTSGSHEIYVDASGKTVPFKCTNKDIPKGTLKSIERITGIKFGQKK